MPGINTTSVTLLAMEFNLFYFITIVITLSFIFLSRTFIFVISRANKKYPPGPPSLPILGHLHLFKNPLHHALSRISNRYGPVVLLRFGSRPVLVVSSASLAHECFTKNDIVFANRVHLPSFKHVTYNYSTLGISNYGPHWRNMRRIATTEVLSNHRLNQFSEVRAAEVRELIQKLFHDCNSDGSFTKTELKARLFHFSLNNLLRMMAGKRSDASEEAVKELQNSVEEVFKYAGASNLGDFIPVLGRIDFQGVQKKMKKHTNYRNRILQKLLDEHKFKMSNANNGVQEERTMIGDLLLLQKSNPQYYTDEIIKVMVISLLAAGTDTSSNTIEWAMALLLNNPDKLKIVQKEIDERTKGERLVQESDLLDLAYLQAVITETLRLYPAGPLLVPHESSEYCVVGGYDVPKGTMLLVNAYFIQRDKSIWENPDEFMPERFLDGNGESRSKLFPFGMGRRSCPGENLANRVVGLVLGAMIQCFEWRRVGDERVDMTEGFGLTLPREVSLLALYKPRDSIQSLLLNL